MSEFCLDCLLQTAVEPAADAQESFLWGSPFSSNRLQGGNQDILSDKLIQPGFDGFQSVKRILDFVQPLAQGNEVVLIFKSTFVSLKRFTANADCTFSPFGQLSHYP
jgi:hypothetical protein